MNRLKIMSVVARLRRETFAYSSIPASGEGYRSIPLDVDPAAQVPRRPSGVTLRRNVVYARRTLPSGRQRVLRMDLHVPTGPGRNPLVVYVPGGGFSVSPKGLAARQRAYLAGTGYVVASVEYRTAPDDARYVDGVADVTSAIRFLRAHAEEYDIDATRVAVWGESAGGYLAAMAAVTAGRGEFETSDNPGHSSAVRAVIDAFGASDLSRLTEGFDKSTSAAYAGMDNAVAHYVNGRRSGKALSDEPAIVSAADPTTYVSDASPPFLILHGDDDRVISPIQTDLLHHALVDAGAHSTRYVLRGAGHGDLSATGAQAKLWTTTTVLDLIRDFLNDHLAPPTDRAPGTE